LFSTVVANEISYKFENDQISKCVNAYRNFGKKKLKWHYFQIIFKIVSAFSKTFKIFLYHNISLSVTPQNPFYFISYCVISASSTPNINNENFAAEREKN
jgi:small-conductance mechanosensitive channel